MTLTLDLPQDLERRLEEEARRLGLSVDAYATQLLGGGSREEEGPRNGAELVEYWRRKGVIGSRSDIEDSAAHAREIRRRAERRDRA